MALTNILSLKTRITSVADFLLKQDFIPILQHIWFTPKTITAYNDVQAIEIKFNSDWHCAVPGRLLSQVLETLTAEELEITQTSNEFVIGQGKNKTTLPILPPTEFVFSFPTPKGIKVVLEPEIAKGLEACLTAVTNDPTRVERNGVTFKIIDKQLTMYSTDGKTITRVIHKGDYKISTMEELVVILPKFFCDQLQKVLKWKNGSAEIYFDEDCAIAIIEDVKIFTRLINATPPQFERALAKAVGDINKIELFPVPDELIHALNRAILIIYPEKGITKSVLKLNESGVITLHTESSKGIAHDDIETPTKYEITITTPVEPALLSRGTEMVNYMAVNSTCWIFSNQERTICHIVSL